MSLYRRSVSAILITLIVLGCAGFTAFRTSGEQVVCTSIAYYSAVDSHDSLLGTVFRTAQSVFSHTSGPIPDTYIEAPDAISGEYMAILFDGQIITVPQLRGDSSDSSVQMAKHTYMQPAKCVAPTKQKSMPAPLHLITKEKVELLM